MSTNAFYLGAYDDTQKWAREAERIAAQRGDESLRAAALAARVAGAAFNGRIDSALELHDEVEPMLDAMDDGVLARQLHVLAGLATAELYLDLYESAHAHAVRGIEVARRTGQTYLLPIFAPVAGTSGWMSGAIEDAITILEDAIEADRLLDNDAVLAWHLYNRAILALVVSDLPGALELSAESWCLAAPLGAGMIPAFSAAVRASVLRENGQPGEAIELLHSRSGGPGLDLLGGGWRGMWLEELVQCHLDQRDLVAAEAAAGRARDWAAAVPTRLALMTARRAEARSALAAGRALDAVALAEESLTYAESMRSPVSIAYSQDVLGAACLAAARPEEAAAAFASASASYASIGAIKYRDRVDAELRKLGHTVHRRTRPGDREAAGLAALTGREMEIAELIRDHLTNREIASELFVSLKTVETHIRNIFNKLGVGSRAEVARLLTAVGEPA
jgi:DNA-binding NarL/FixJ family response regulator